MANEAVDSVRRRLSKERMEAKRYFALFPELQLAYETKESFFAIWRATGSVAAKARYAEWRVACPPEVVADFKPLHTAMQNWGEYIFNYFDHPHTNAFTEASNRRI